MVGLSAADARSESLPITRLPEHPAVRDASSRRLEDELPPRAINAVGQPPTATLAVRDRSASSTCGS
jgi:hypothetical protein